MLDLNTIKEKIKNRTSKTVIIDSHDVKINLWDGKELKKLNSLYQIQEFISPYIGIGSKDNELLAINPIDGKCYLIPLIPLDLEESVLISENFDTLPQ